MIGLTGGPRAFDRAGFRDEEGTNWERAELLVSAQLVAPRTTPYELGPGSGVSSEAFNRAAHPCADRPRGVPGVHARASR